jgi:hypothetical protein
VVYPAALLGRRVWRGLEDLLSLARFKGKMVFDGSNEMGREELCPMNPHVWDWVSSYLVFLALDRNGRPSALIAEELWSPSSALSQYVAT